MTKTLGIVALAAFIGTIVMANFLTEHFGFVSVGFGLTATAGTYAAGMALGLRDAVHEALGRVTVVLAIVAGAGLTWFISPAFAVASGTAFLVSELCDFGVYAPLRERNVYGAVLASNVVGAVVDTVLFLGLAFGWASIAGAWQGQVVGKLWITAATLVAMFLVRAAWSRREATA
jgi:hypothetical protein